ncbi:hypothetical protein BV22DRAFT_988602, partial [Leucogyrophana mollusca]
SHPQYSTHGCRMRSRPVIPVLLADPFPRPNRGDEELEKFCKVMVLLFKPWRKLSDIKGEYKTWKDAYDSYAFPNHLIKLIQNVNVENECKDARDSY